MKMDKTWIRLGSNVFQCLDSGRSFFLTPTSHVIAIAIAIPSVAPGHQIRCLGVSFCHVLSNDTQGLVNVPFWEFWTSLSNICWRLYPQYLGDVHLGHLPTPDTGKTDNVVKKMPCLPPHFWWLESHLKKMVILRGMVCYKVLTTLLEKLILPIWKPNLFERFWDDTGNWQSDLWAWNN